MTSELLTQAYCRLGNFRDIPVKIFIGATLYHVSVNSPYVCSCHRLLYEVFDFHRRSNFTSLVNYNIMQDCCAGQWTAIVMTVHSRNSLLMVFWMRSSFSRSTAAVASSNTRIFVFRGRARARHTNWHWPTLEKKKKKSVIKRWSL